MISWSHLFDGDGGSVAVILGAGSAVLFDYDSFFDVYRSHYGTG